MSEQVRFDGRVAVVTGAGRGMGRSHALLLAKRGASVVVNDLGATTDGDGSSSQPAAEVVAEIQAAGGNARATFDDIATEEGAQFAVDAALESFGRVDIIVNNAGIFRLTGFGEMTAERFERTMRVNAYGPFYVTKAAWPHLVEQSYGRVVNISSAAGLFGFPGRVHYGTAKAAVIGLTRTLAAEGFEHGIRVNAVAPGALTRMTSDPAAARKRMADAVGLRNDSPGLDELLQRSVEHVSPMVAWLAHERCTVNGEIFEATWARASRWFIGSTRGYTNPAPTIEDIRDHFTEIMD